MTLAWGAAAETLAMGMGITLAPSSREPHYRFAGETDNTLEHLHWRLIREGPNKEMTPGLARSWRAVDGRTWESMLRPEAKFSDGSPVTAEDVACSLWRVPRIEGSPGSYVVFTRAIEAVEVAGPRTPYPFIPVDMARILIAPSSLGGLGSAGRTRHSSPRADALVREALASMADAKRNALFAEAARIAPEEETIIIFVYCPSCLYAARHGMTAQPLNDARFLAREIRKQ